LAVVAASVLLSWGPGALPSSLALSALGLLAAAALLVAAGAGARRGAGAETVFVAFCWAWVVAGAFNVLVALVQVFWPELPDGEWIAASGIPGRAVGNLRQPNHLSSLLLWSTIAALALAELGRLARAVAFGLAAAFVFGVVLTASRTGLLSVLLLALWGVLDRRLSRPGRWLLWAAPLIYALSWVALAQWAEVSSHAFGGSQRLAEGDISSSRFGIWANTLELIRREPWLGVGFGEFNLAWTLTPFPGRPTAFFDHTHNLPLQFAVELGLPLAALVMGLLLWALAGGLRRAWSAPGPLGSGQRAAMLMVLMIGLHSLLEYPLWYSYFLLPAAWAWGFALGREGGPVGATVAPPSRALGWGAAALAAGALLSVADYVRVAVIFAAPEGAAPLEQRIEAGRRSLFFAHHADYAAVTSGVKAPEPERAFASTTHYLLDTRLMIAWADWLQQRGDGERARHLAARLREFRKADAQEFFAPCAVSPVPSAGPAAAAATVPDYPCRPPTRTPSWREFLTR
jgi:hypothetical protein